MTDSKYIINDFPFADQKNETLGLAFEACSLSGCVAHKPDDSKEAKHPETLEKYMAWIKNIFVGKIKNDKFHILEKDQENFLDFEKNEYVCGRDIHPEGDTIYWTIVTNHGKIYYFGYNKEGNHVIPKYLNCLNCGLITLDMAIKLNKRIFTLTLEESKENFNIDELVDILYGLISAL